MILNKSKKKILLMTGKFGGYTALKNLIDLISIDKELDFKLLITDQHMQKKFGTTHKIISSEIDKKKLILVKTLANKDTINSKLLSFSKLSISISNVIHSYKPNLIIIYGDRGETLITSFVAVNHNIPIAHFQGGDLSGNIDEIFRHAISKMSNYHFVSNKFSKSNLIKMGEKKNSIFNVGELHIDTIRKIKKLPWSVINKNLNLNFSNKNNFVILHYHPETYSKSDDYKTINEILSVLVKNNFKVVCLHPCSDQGYKKIVSSILNSIKKLGKDKIYLFKNIEPNIYINLIKKSNFFIGNSSSGIIELPYLKKIFINVGVRQKNRLCDNNVIHLTSVSDLQKILKKIKKLKNIKMKYFYGKGIAANKSITIIKKIINQHVCLKKLEFKTNH